MSRADRCPECRGSGRRRGFRGDDLECFDCDGTGEWADADELAFTETKRDRDPETGWERVTA